MTTIIGSYRRKTSTVTPRVGFARYGGRRNGLWFAVGMRGWYWTVVPPRRPAANDDAGWTHGMIDAFGFAVGALCAAVAVALAVWLGPWNGLVIVVYAAIRAAVAYRQAFHPKTEEPA